jgi:hypothetical protein
MRAVLGLANEYKATGGFGDYERLRNLNADPTLISRDFATRTSTGEAKLKANQIARQRFYEQYLGGLAEFGAEHATALQAGAYGLNFAGRGIGLLGRAGGALGGRVGGALASAAAQRVFVVNWPAGGVGGGALGGGTPPGRLGKVLAVTGVGLAAYEATRALDDATGGRISSGAAAGIGWLSGQREKLAGIEAAGREVNQLQLERRKRQRDALVLDLEAKGLTHGAALNAADQQLKAEIKQVNVVINGDEAHAEVDGTRSPKAMVRRGAIPAEDLD